MKKALWFRRFLFLFFYFTLVVLLHDFHTGEKKTISTPAPMLLKHLNSLSVLTVKR